MFLHLFNLLLFTVTGQGGKTYKGLQINEFPRLQSINQNCFKWLK